MTTTTRNIDAYHVLREGIDKLPEHRQRRVLDHWTQSLGYAWGRQDEAGRMDHEEAWGFAIFSATRCLEYVTEQSCYLRNIPDLWKRYHEKEEPISE